MVIGRAQFPYQWAHPDPNNFEDIAPGISTYFNIF